MSEKRYAGKRLALVIGNSAYQNVSALENPRRDAAKMVAALQGLEFEVISAIDLGQADLQAKLQEFYTKLNAGGVGLLFYAGHGVQVWGRNYLLPCDTRIARASDLRSSAIPLNDVVRAMARRAKTRLLFLDACRNDPISGEAGGLTRGARSAPAIGSDIADVGQGLAKITATAGTFVAYATEPGNVALDGTGENSPFTTALLRHIGEPGLAVDDVMMQVRVDVLEATESKQLPWSESALTHRFQFKEGPAQNISRDFEQEYWDRVKDTDNPDFLESFLRQFPGGRHDADARARLDSARVRKEASDWKQANALSTIPALAAFVRRYPASKLAGVARTKLFLRQFGRGAVIVGCAVLAAIALAASLAYFEYLGEKLQSKFLMSVLSFISRMASFGSESHAGLALLVILPLLVTFAGVVWFGLARLKDRPARRGGFAAATAVVPLVICGLGMQLAEPLAPSLKETSDKSRERAKRVYRADYTARLWDAGTGKEIAVLKGHTEDINSAAFSPDSKKVATAGQDGSVRVWDQQGNEIAAWKQAKRIRGAVFGPDSKLVLLWDNEGARIWDSEADKVVAELPERKHVLRSAFFSLDGKRVLTETSGGIVRLWNADSAADLGALGSSRTRTRKVMFSPDSKRVMILTLTSGSIYDAETGKQISNLEGHKEDIRGGIFSHDSKRIATASADRTVRIWDAETGKELFVLEGHKGTVQSLAFSLDDKHLASASNDQTARLWDATNGKELIVLKGHTEQVVDVYFGADGKRLVTEAKDEPARLWNDQGKEMAILGSANLNSAPLSLARRPLPLSPSFSPDGRHAVTPGENLTAEVWDAETGKKVAVLKGHGREVKTAVFSPDGARVLTSADDTTERTLVEEEIRNADLYRLTGEARFHRLLVAGLAGLAVGCTLLLSAIAISGSKQLELWGYSIRGGVLGGALFTLALSTLVAATFPPLSSDEDFWQFTALLLALACWAAMVAFLALGLTRAAAYDVETPPTPT